MSYNEELIILGTGHATVTECYNTCFVLRIPGSTLLVDGGGGNGILQQMKKAGVYLSTLTALFVTHAHTDHLFGIVWVLRMMGEEVSGRGDFRRCIVYGHDKVLNTLKYICKKTLTSTTWNNIQAKVIFKKVYPDQCLMVGENLKLHFFDTKSSDEKQYGFKAYLPNGKTLVCLGDIPCHERLFSYVKDTDWLLCEAFCREADKDIFHPHKLHHSTVLDAAMAAERLNVKNLILYHTEDTALYERKDNYTEEACKVYSGGIYVPDDLETIIL